MRSNTRTHILEVTYKKLIKLNIKKSHIKKGEARKWQ